MLIGNLDVVDQIKIAGWALDDSDFQKRVVLELFDGDELVFRFKAESLRHDFLDRGKGDGYCGFWIRLPKDLFPLSLHKLSVRFAETGNDIGNSPRQLYSQSGQIDSAFSDWFLGKIDAAAAVANTAEGLAPLMALCLNGLDRLLHSQTQFDASSSGTATASVSLAQMPDRLRSVMELAIRNCVPFHVPPISKPTLSVIIAATPSLRDTHGLIRSLSEAALRYEMEIICVDATGTMDLALVPLLVRGGVRFVKTAMVDTALNAYRLGLTMARGNMVLFLSGCIDVSPHAIGLMLQTLRERDNQALVTPRLVGLDGRIVEAGAQFGPMASRIQIGRYDQADSQFYRICRASDDASPQAFMIARGLLDRLGGLKDVERFGNFAISDLSFRARQSGHAVIVQGAAAVIASGTTDFAQTDKQSRNLFAKKWHHMLEAVSDSHTVPQKRVLVVDERLPNPNHDAASMAIVSHCESLLRLGYHVEFVAATYDKGAEKVADELFSRGIEAHTDVEDVGNFIASRSGQFEIVYLHRLSVARMFLEACKKTQPQARVIYSVADLHFLRLARQADIEDSAELKIQAKAVEIDEKKCLSLADHIITHSSVERDWIVENLHPPRPVHRILWAYQVKPASAPFSNRKNIAFLGNYRHQPNVDAVRQFAQVLWPRISSAADGHSLEIAGAFMNSGDFAGLASTVQLRGFVPDIDTYLGGLRLTIAPLRYGAGVKGKVLQSFAAGVPCVMSPIAAEGMGLPGTITDALVAADDERFVELVTRLAKDEDQWNAASTLVRDWAIQNLTAASIDICMTELMRQ